jgi:hypothetical protein
MIFPHLDAVLQHHTPTRFSAFGHIFFNQFFTPYVLLFFEILNFFPAFENAKSFM